MLIMQSPCHDGKQISDWQDRGHRVKIALLAKAVSNPALLLPLLTLPGSPGTCTAPPLASASAMVAAGRKVPWHLQNGNLKGWMWTFLLPCSQVSVSSQAQAQLFWLIQSAAPVFSPGSWVLHPFQEYQMRLFTQAVDCYPLSPMKLKKINIGM